jgi:hypothetical protein
MLPSNIKYEKSEFVQFADSALILSQNCMYESDCLYDQTGLKKLEFIFIRIKMKIKRSIIDFVK